MPVDLDEPRHHDSVLGVEDLRARSAEIGTDRDDAAVPDMNVSAWHIADPGIDAEYISALDEVIATRRSAGLGGACDRRLAAVGQQRHRRQSSPRDHLAAGRNCALIFGHDTPYY
jgi:hypothetical protein